MEITKKTVTVIELTEREVVILRDLLHWVTPQAKADGGTESERLCMDLLHQLPHEGA